MAVKIFSSWVLIKTKLSFELFITTNSILFAFFPYLGFCSQGLGVYWFTLEWYSRLFFFLQRRSVHAKHLFIICRLFLELLFLWLLLESVLVFLEKAVVCNWLLGNLLAKIKEFIIINIILCCFRGSLLLNLCEVDWP